MNTYENLINEMNEYLNSEDIQSDSEKVSVYDFKCALEHKLAGIKNAINNPELTKIKLRNLFNAVRICGIEGIDINSYGDFSIVVKLDLGFNNYTYAEVGKQMENEELFFDLCYDKRIKHVMEQATPFFQQIFFELEKCRDLFYSGTIIFFASFSADLFKFTISYDIKGNVYVFPLKLANSRNDDGIGYRTWLSRKSINKVFEENSEKLYSKVPLDVSKLSITYQNVICEYLKSKKEMKLTLD